MKNVIAFRKELIVLPENEQKNSDGEIYAMTVIAELMQFGFLPTEKARLMLVNAPRHELIKFHGEVVEYLKDITGSARNYQPFWKGFPEQVMELSELELWLHQIVHYISRGTYLPDEWTRARPTAFEQPNYRFYEAASEADFLNIFTALVSVNQSLTPQDLADVKWFAGNVRDLPVPEVIPFKENLTTLASLGVPVKVKSVTDVLRIAVGMSGGDVSLPKVPPRMVKTNAWKKKQVLTPNEARAAFKFRKFNRAERRLLLGLLENTNCDASEAVLKDERWLRLGEILHPGEYARQFPKASAMFQRVRNTRVRSWYGTVENLFKTSFEQGLEELASRPGEFLRRVDALLRHYPQKIGVVLEVFNKIAGRVSNKVLFEAYGHFERPKLPVMSRSVMVKGSRKRTKLPDLYALPSITVDSIQEIIVDALRRKFKELPMLGKVWIDPELKKIPVPTNMRSVSESMTPTVRGQRAPVGNQTAKTIRAFVHWFDERGDQDIDLSATFVGMGVSDVISWNGNHRTDYGAHSGDIRHVRGACAEYVDFDVSACLRRGFKYVIIDARNFNGEGFDTLNECVFGWMEREFPQANEIFKPNTLVNSIRLQSESANILVAVIDVETREYIFLDLDQDGLPVASIAKGNILEAIKPYCEPPRFSVYDLLFMHAEARAEEIVADKTQADLVFDYQSFAKNYIETLKFMGV